MAISGTDAHLVYVDRGIKEKIATVPPLSSEMPLYKGHLHGETMAEGLPKRLPKGLPMLQHILIADTHQKEKV